MQLNRRHLLLLLVAAGFSGPTLAAPTTYDFTATVTYDTYDTTSLDNQSVTGYFTLNPAAASSSSGGLNYTGSNATLAKQVFSFYLNLPTGQFTSSTLTTGYDTITGGGNAVAGYTWNAEQGNGSEALVLSLGPITQYPLDSGGQLINANAALALTGVNALPQGNYLEVYGASSNQLLDFSFTSISPVPLPATLPLLLSGIGLLGFAGRRRMFS